MSTCPKCGKDLIGGSKVTSMWCEECLDSKKLPDTQNEKDTRNVAIDKVGIRNFKAPFKVKQKDGNIQTTVAKISMYGSLNEKTRGTNMSRFAQTIMEAVDKDISVEFIDETLSVLKNVLESKDSYVKVRFPYFIKKAAPVTKTDKRGNPVTAYNTVECFLEGEMVNDKKDVYLTCEIEYTSVCPCSKNMSLQDKEKDVGKGAHNQRSMCRVKVHLKDFFWIEDLVEIVESKASCQIYNVLKREDEQYVTEKAYANPKFVEDMVRDIAIELNKRTEIDGYVVVNEHYESIHQYNAVAVTRGGTHYIH